MKIAVFIADLGAGGAQKVATDLMNYLSINHDVICITLTSELSFHSLDPNVKRAHLAIAQTHNRLLNNIKRIKAARLIWKKEKPDIVISFIAPTNVLAILSSIGLTHKVIISERNDPSRQSFGRMWDILRRFLYRFADTITANSKNALDTLETYVPKHKLYLIPNAISEPDQEYVCLSTEKEKTFLIVGRLHPQKSHETLLQAYAQITNTHPDWQLVIVGDGPLKQNLESLANNLQIDVTFAGQQPNPYSYLSKAAFFVLPSLYEGTPNTLLESMSCGTVPIISDAITGELIENEVNGFVFKTRNVQDLAKSMDRAISLFENDKTRYETYANLCIKITKSFNPKKVFSLWDTVIGSNTP